MIRQSVMVVSPLGLSNIPILKRHLLRSSYVNLKRRFLSLSGNGVTSDHNAVKEER